VEHSEKGNPITSDPETVDWDFPPMMVPVIIDSHGDNLNGILYISQGPGPHPTVIMLHGYPGDEKNLDLAQAIRRTGWNVLFFHYRGAWGSAGEFSIDHALEDVEAAFDFLVRPESKSNYRVDPGHIALLGHSMGAYLALVAGSHMAAIRQIVALTPINLWLITAHSGPEMWAALSAGFEAMGHGAIRGSGGPEQYARISQNPSQYDLLERVAGLDGKSLLLVGAVRDEDAPKSAHYEPLVKCLQERNKASVTPAMLDTDHVFSTARIALARLVTGWLADTSPR
jgi:dipeptidyl aminopeptidase/acylaminoacyl peptidase